MCVSDLGRDHPDFLAKVPHFMWEAAEAECRVRDPPEPDCSRRVEFFPSILCFPEICFREAAWPLVLTWDN